MKALRMTHVTPSWGLLCACLLGVACGRDEVPTVAPAPAVDQTPAQPAAEPDIPRGEAPPPDDPEPTSPSAGPAQAATTAKPAGASSTKQPAPVAKSAAAEAASPQAPAPTQAPHPTAPATPEASSAAKPPEPTAPSPPAAPAPAPKRTVLPSTAHVRYSVGAGMQALLDADSRMEPWLRRITPVIDTCYGELSGKPTGAVQLGLVMHKNERPSIAINSLPGPLAALAPCVTTRLMGQRPPLFTGPEGEKHTVSIHFTP